MWNGNVIDTCDGRDLINVVLKSRHLNRIISRLKMYSPFKNLLREDKENFIMNAIQAIRSFLIHEEKL